MTLDEWLKETAGLLERNVTFFKARDVRKLLAIIEAQRAELEKARKMLSACLSEREEASFGNAAIEARFEKGEI
jgi:hypothetical protein